MLKKRSLSVVYLVVFATGASGLIFQVTWQKYVGRLLGSDSVATAIILGAFLGGLSLGYYLCGRVSPRITNHVRVYALLEGAIGLWCLMFPQIFQGVEALTRSWSFAPPLLLVIQGMMCAVLLMGVPTICMGGTIPLLTRGLSESVTEATQIHASVYAVNTFGAFLGALLAGFYLIPTHGLPLTMMSTACVNLTVCLSIYLLAGRMARPQQVERELEPTRDRSSAMTAGERRFPASVLCAVAFLSGFYVMTLENVLIRILNISVGSSSYSFSLIVAVFILAIALGSRIVSRMHRIPRATLVINQTLITVTLLLIYLSLDTWPYGAHLIRILFQSHILGFWAYYAAVFFVLSALLLVPVALMGATLPLAFHELKRDLRQIGAHAGLLFSWNTLGSLAGSLVGGIGLYYLWNNDRVFLFAALCAACSALLLGRALSKRHALAPLLLTALVLGFLIGAPLYDQRHFIVGPFFARTPLATSFSGPRRFFDNFITANIIRLYKDDPLGTVAVLEGHYDHRWNLTPQTIMVNGKSDSTTIGDMYTIALLAHLPALLAESRDNVMVIGLGTGVTAGELTLYHDVRQIDIAEISPTVIAALPLFQEATHHLQDDPRVRIHEGDAFRILGRSNKRWDIIISEPSNPWVSGVDMLFTREFYQLASAHLTDQGVLMQWIHVYAANPTMVGMILNTLQQEFPYCRGFLSNLGDVLIVAAKQPIAPRQLQTAERLLQENPGVKASLDRLALGAVDAILIRELWPPEYLRDHFTAYDIQTMDNPRLHYIAGQNYFIGGNLPSGYLFPPDSAAYWPNYLLSQKYLQWAQFPVSREQFDALRLASTDLISNDTLPMYHALTLKAFLHDPAQFQLSAEQQQRFRMTLLKLAGNPAPDDADWSAVGLQGASFRAKAEALLQHTQGFRNWIVPYPLDGLRKVLEAGMQQSATPADRNWCTLQLALLLITTDHDWRQAEMVLSGLKRQLDGAIVLDARDQGVLFEVQQWLLRSKVR